MLFHWLSIAMISAGTLLLISALKPTCTLCRQSRINKRGWRMLLGLIICFIIGYGALLLQSVARPLPVIQAMIVASVLLSGAVFVALIIRLSHRSLTASHVAANEAEIASMHDHLTQLPNRRCFMRDTEYLIANVEPFALLMIDLNKFKQINDIFGHLRGDDLLKQISLRLDESLLPQQSLYRLGGDEFAMLERVPDRAAQTAEQIQRTMSGPVALGELQIDIGASIGIARFPEHGTVMVQLLSRADMAMYDAKRQGLTWAWFEPQLDVALQRKLQISTNLRRAVATDALVMHYQPIFTADGQKVRALEALVRWPIRDGEFIAPSEFIPIAEEERMVDAITQWVIREAIGQLRVWLDKGFDLRLNINLSALDLQNPHLWPQIDRALKLNRVPPERLVFELTESAMMHDADRATESLRTIAHGGAGIAIDDFGTGYSSLARLRRLPITQIKIDRSFVFDVLENEQDAAVVTATVYLARKLGCTVTAEGVESEAIAWHLHSLGCDNLQGFHLARPAPADALEDFLDNHALTRESRSVDTLAPA
ncbi:MAG: EAL domain-containing protein [Gammaproteobacteria bacterium]|nr:EAL domain-containing protein [Gammaproteobacteria bacterium]